MSTAEKIELIRSIMDELAIIGYLSDARNFTNAIDTIKDYLQGFTIPTNPTKADLHINNAKLLVCANTGVLSNVLKLASSFLEMALTELSK